jgi:hypothetical protein|tara:strand:+ start:282 stop:479 length:198 start_codon:yes stop_codon:yes gene_type:complete
MDYETLIKNIAKYDKIINDSKKQKYNEMKKIFDLCDNYKPKKNVEILIYGIYLQNKILIQNQINK